MDQKLVQEAERFLQEGSFRNKSHLIEYSVKKFLEGRK